MEINLLDRYPRSKRPIGARAAAVSPEHRALARQFGRDYFDGSRMTGYGGYAYHPRFWTDTVDRIATHYRLPPDARILDVGCAKGFMLHDFQKRLPKATILGLDVSRYALEHAIETMRPCLVQGDARQLPFADDSVDLALSINTLHNLGRDDFAAAAHELQRVSKKHCYIVVDAWRNDEERARLLDWNLTARTYMSDLDWKRYFKDIGYLGDYGWFIAE